MSFAFNRFGGSARSAEILRRFRSRVWVGEVIGFLAVLAILVGVNHWVIERYIGHASQSATMRAAEVLSDAALAVGQTGVQHSRHCTGQLSRQLRDTVADFWLIDQIGLVSPAGDLVCTNWGSVLESTNYDDHTGAVGRLELLGVQSSDMLGRKVFVFVMRQSDDWTVVALASLQPLFNQLAGPDGIEHRWIRSSDRSVVLAAAANYRAEDQRVKQAALIPIPHFPHVSVQTLATPGWWWREHLKALPQSIIMAGLITLAGGRCLRLIAARRRRVRLTQASSAENGRR